MRLYITLISTIFCNTVHIIHGWLGWRYLLAKGFVKILMIFFSLWILNTSFFYVNKFHVSLLNFWGVFSHFLHFLFQSNVHIVKVCYKFTVIKSLTFVVTWVHDIGSRSQLSTWMYLMPYKCRVLTLNLKISLVCTWLQ